MQSAMTNVTPISMINVKLYHSEKYRYWLIDYSYNNIIVVIVITTI